MLDVRSKNERENLVSDTPRRSVKRIRDDRPRQSRSYDSSDECRLGRPSPRGRNAIPLGAHHHDRRVRARTDHPLATLTPSRYREAEVLSSGKLRLRFSLRNAPSLRYGAPSRLSTEFPPRAVSFSGESGAAEASPVASAPGVARKTRRADAPRSPSEASPVASAPGVARTSRRADAPRSPSEASPVASAPGVLRTTRRADAHRSPTEASPVASAPGVLRTTRRADAHRSPGFTEHRGALPRW
jgi:hypothetical protein